MNQIKGVRFSEVLSVEDKDGAGRIKAAVYPEDYGRPVEQIDYATPYLPNMIHIRPKVGEGVLILLSMNEDGDSQRFYVGPLISQPNRMYDDPFFMGSDAYFRGSYKSMDPNPDSDPESKGAYPKFHDIALIGRSKSDIILTDNDIRIRAGVKLPESKNPRKILFNKKNPAYIKVKHSDKAVMNGTTSTASIVADKILLLSHGSSEKRGNNSEYNLTDPEDLITDKELGTIINEAYKLPYGEKLVEFLKKFVKVFINHTHDYPCLPPNSSFINEIKDASNGPLEKEELLSNTVRIN